MRILILSDIHANLDALEACLSVVPAHDMVVNLGDVVGYNASPNEVCAIVRDIGGLIVRGNHDRVCSGLVDVKEFNPIAAISAYWTNKNMEPDHLEWLRALPPGPLRRDALPGVEFVHGSPRDEDEYLLNTFTADSNLRLPGHLSRIFFGHTHIQGGFLLNEDKTYPFGLEYENDDGLAMLTVQLERQDRYLINPGSIGQPRDGDCRAAFALYNETDATVTFYRVPYPVNKAQERILAASLPQRLADRLGMGR